MSQPACSSAGVMNLVQMSRSDRSFLFVIRWSGSLGWFELGWAYNDQAHRQFSSVAEQLSECSALLCDSLDNYQKPFYCSICWLFPAVPYTAYRLAIFIFKQAIINQTTKKLPCAGRKHLLLSAYQPNDLHIIIFKPFL